jgi:hypothetical protein
MGTENDIPTIESGADPGPTYDRSTDKVYENGETRDPHPIESVRAAFQKHRAERDPIEGFRQRAEQRGAKLEDVLGRVKEFDDIGDPYEQMKWFARHRGIDPREAAARIYNEQADVAALQAGIQKDVASAVSHRQTTPRYRL